MASVALFFNGFGLYLTMKAGIGAAPWDVFNLGISKTFGVLYGTASITVAFIILIIDVLLKEPIGLAMIIDSIVVGKAVDFFNYIDFVPSTDNIPASILTLVAGLFVMGYTQLFYMRASLGCGPRDTLLVGLSKRIRKIPIGVVAIGLLSAATLTGYLLGGPVGLGTILCAVFQGPIMQFAFKTFSFDATTVKHQSISESIKVFAHRTA
ncbi:MAG: hypothetical protein IK121_03215 [Lachnospiraceae bacterium]|nr:hypothetical protein [Lachnospiraceae bacterium]